MVTVGEQSEVKLRENINEKERTLKKIIVVIGKQKPTVTALRKER